MEGLFSTMEGADGAGKKQQSSISGSLCFKKHTLVGYRFNKRAWWKSYLGRYSGGDSGCE